MNALSSDSLADSVCTPAELMVAAAAREIHDFEIVFVGMRLPLIAFAVAKRTHAPNAIGLFENGVVRETPDPSCSTRWPIRQICAARRLPVRCLT